MSGVVHLVHCVDAEGPLEEPLLATFDRVRDAFGVVIPPSRENLDRLQAGTIALGGIEDDVARFVAPERLAYLTTWSAIELVIADATSDAFRNRFADPAGRPVQYSWFVIDVVGYIDNPRRKPAGWHMVWDQYQRMLDRPADDSLGWHFHTVPVGGHALEYNTSWTNNDWHEQVLCRRVIERESFPSIWRAGGAIQRNDQSHWLEQYVPFDYSSRASDMPGGGGPGLQWDWRGAPQSWRPYHPDYRDYRRPGGMGRWVFRCLDVDSPDCHMRENDIETAFEEALHGGDVALCYTDHDRRDIRPHVAQMWEMVSSVAARYPGVSWRWANAHQAARLTTGCAVSGAPHFEASWEGDLLRIRTDRPLFGPQPFLAVQEEGDVFYRDNMTQEGGQEWAWRPARPHAVQRVGVAGASTDGETACLVIDSRHRG